VKHVPAVRPVLSAGTVVLGLALFGLGWLDLVAADVDLVRLQGHGPAALAFLLAALLAMHVSRRLPLRRIAQRVITLAILLPPAVFTLLDR
jgi:hypothetical protein